MAWSLTINLVQVCQVPWQASVLYNVEVKLVPGCQSSQSRSWECGQGACIESSDGSIDQPKDENTKGEFQHDGDCESKVQLQSQLTSDQTVIHIGAYSSISPCARAELPGLIALIIQPQLCSFRMYLQTLTKGRIATEPAPRLPERGLAGEETLAHRCGTALESLPKNRPP